MPVKTSAPACRDEIKTNLTGEGSLLGFPIAYTTTAPGPRCARIQPGLPRRGGEAAKAGVIRVGVPELANKTTHDVDTRALRTQLIAELVEQKMDAVPLAAAPQDELHAYAKELGCDYLLVTNITELKASKPGRIGRMIKATAGETPRDVTEAKLTVQLVPVGGPKPRFSTNTSGNDGGMGGFLNNPLLAQMQGGAGGMGGIGGGFGGMDRTAGAAMFIMDQAMAGAGGDGTHGGPSFDASLAEALQEGAKKVGENLKR